MTKETEKVMDSIPAIVSAVEKLQLNEYPSAWNALDVLSNQTRIDGIEVDPAGINVKGDQFDGLASVYVVLDYGSKRDRFTTSDAFRGKFSGHISAGEPVIEDFNVDTSPFYAGERASG